MIGVTSDMGHVDLYLFYLEEQVLGILQAYNMVVDVAVHSPKRFEGSELLGSLDGSNIPCMPYLIHVLKEAKDLGDNGPMGVGEKTNTFHGFLMLEIEQDANAQDFLELDFRVRSFYGTTQAIGNHEWYIIVVDKVGGDAAVEP